MRDRLVLYYWLFSKLPSVVPYLLGILKDAAPAVVVVVSVQEEGVSRDKLGLVWKGRGVGFQALDLEPAVVEVVAVQVFLEVVVLLVMRSYTRSGLHLSSEST